MLEKLFELLIVCKDFFLVWFGFIKIKWVKFVMRWSILFGRVKVWNNFFDDVNIVNRINWIV